MQRQRDNDNFLPITFGICLVITIGAYVGLNKSPEQEQDLAHHEYNPPQMEIPASPEAETLLEAEPTNSHDLVDFQNDVLSTKTLSKNKDLLISKADSEMMFSYQQNFFRRSSHELYRSARRQLDAIAPLLKKHGYVMIKIYGHTDKSPTLKRSYRKWNTNEKLSELRSEAVQEYLIQKGVNPYHITIVEDHHKQNLESADRGISMTFQAIPTTSTLAGVIE